MGVIKGKHYANDKIKFTGKDTSMSFVWRCSADTYRDIYHSLVNMGVISIYDEDPVDKYLLKKLGKTYDDFTNDDDEVDIDAIYLEGGKFLTDEAYREIITEEDGNAYYQEWEVLNERRECETMPLDKDGCHATGYEVFDGSVWWAEYKDEDGNVFLAN